MTLYTLIGLPASGKSTFAKSHPECVTICPDEIRQEFFGDAANQSHGDLVFAVAWARINQALAENKDVIFDATNCQRKYRKSIFKNTPKETKHVAVVFNTPIDVCKKRNSKRNRKVPESVIERMSAKFSKPTKEEGFDEIIEINT